jgi:hypothetical protein
MKAENAEVKEQLRRMQEGQKILIEQLDSLRRRLDRAANASTTGKPALTMADVPDTAANAPSGDSQAVTDPADTSGKPASGKNKQGLADRYRDGIIIWQTADDAAVPFALRLNNNTQLRYLNTLNANDSFTDHLGVVREVHRRNDITVNRSMFILAGYIWDKRVRYSLTVWTSAGAASIVVAGNIGWQFNRHITLMAGYTGVPEVDRLLTPSHINTSTDRSMADNFFRPGFTQGLWAFGDITKDLHYWGFVGNSLNTLSITAAKIDTNLMGSGSIWWEPLGEYGEPASRSTCTMIISPRKRSASDLVRRSRCPAKTDFQISMYQVLRTLRCTIPTASLRSRPELSPRV